MTETDPATTEEEPPPAPTTTAEEPPPAPPAEPGPLPPPPSLAGRRGVVTVDIPEVDVTGEPVFGEVRVGQRVWPAASEDGGTIPQGAAIEVAAVEPDHLIVRRRPGG